MGLDINLDRKNRSRKKSNSVRKKTKKSNSNLLEKLKARVGNFYSNKRAFYSTIVVLLLSTMLFIGYESLQAMIYEKYNVRIGITDIFPTKNPQLQKDGKGRTNFLLVGKDTRTTNGGLNNTDSIIIASYIHESNEAVMISVPRDTAATIPGENRYRKINGIYKIAEQREEGSGLPTLVDTIENMYGLEIQYYGMVDLKAFTDIVDNMGGVEVGVENSFTDYRFPLPNDQGVTTISFQEGTEIMDGERALQYARSRHSLDNGEGSDFARAKRQQNLLLAIKDKVLSSETLMDPTWWLDLAETLDNNIENSEYSGKDIKAAIALRDKADSLEVYSFVLDPSIANSQILQTGVIPGYSIGPQAGLGKNDEVKAYIDAILENPEFYKEEVRIGIYDIGLGYNETFQRVEELREEYPYKTFIYRGTLNVASPNPQNYIYINNEETDLDRTSKAVSEYLNLDLLNESPDFINPNISTDELVILFGEENIE